MLTIKAKVQDQILLPEGSYNVRHEGKDLRSLEKPTFAHITHTGTLEINGRIRGAGRRLETELQEAEDSETPSSPEPNSRSPGPEAKQRPNAFEAFQKGN